MKINKIKKIICLIVSLGYVFFLANFIQAAVDAGKLKKVQDGLWLTLYKTNTKINDLKEAQKEGDDAVNDFLDEALDVYEHDETNATEVKFIKREKAWMNTAPDCKDQPCSTPGVKNLSAAQDFGQFIKKENAAGR